MSIRIKYAYLSGQVWLYRRNYPQDVRLVLGSQALKQSLKTSDAKVARTRAQEVNALYEAQVSKVRDALDQSIGNLPQSEPVTTRVPSEWGRDAKAVVAHLRAALASSEAVSFQKASAAPRSTIAELAKVYHRRRGNELRPGGYKSVRYSVGLFASKFGDLSMSSLTREVGRQFLSQLPELSTVLGKSPRTYKLSLEQSVAFSRGRPDRISVRTQKRIWSQVSHFLDWAVYEGQASQNPFRTVRFEGKVRPEPYAVLTDDEVFQLISARDPTIHNLLLFCLLTGMRSGEAAGLLREDILAKGNLGSFVQVKPNRVRELKTDASERVVPVHPVLQDVLQRLPASGELFPGLKVNIVTKRFAHLRVKLALERPGLVFHSTRKWFITQCERTGVPEHFTASLVGHKSARSENKLTYGIYSAGISDEQKRSIVDQIRLPPGLEP